MRNRARLADEIAALPQLFDDPRPGLRRREPGEHVVNALRPVGVRGLPAADTPRDRPERPVGLDNRPDRQAQLAPPRDVRDVAEGTNHRDAAAFFRIGEGVRLDRHAHAEQRRGHLFTEERPVTLVVRMGHQGDAGRNQFRPGRVDLDRPEPDPVKGTGHFAILELGLRHRGFEIDVPQRRRFHLVCEASLQQVEKRELRHALRGRADRRVRHRPVDGQTEILPEMFEGLLVFDRQARAELDEVRTRYRDRWLRRLRRRRKRRVVRQRGVAAHTVIVLHAPFGRQAVVVPSHRIEHRFAPHPLESRDEVRVGVREDVAHVQRAADRGRRRVDGEDVGARARTIEPVHASCFPACDPFGFKPLQRGLLRQWHPTIVLLNGCLDPLDLFADETFRDRRHEIRDGLADDAIGEVIENTPRHLLDHLVLRQR